MQVLRPKDLEAFHLVCQVTSLSSEANVYDARNPTISTVYTVTSPLECVSWSSSECSSLRGTNTVSRFSFASTLRKKVLLKWEPNVILSRVTGEITQTPPSSGEPALEWPPSAQ